MDDQRKKIIIKEIEHWRKNHLLPEHYCIFLLNLYTAGEHHDQGAAERGGHSASSKGQSFPGQSFSGDTGSLSLAVSWKMVLFWLVGAGVLAGLILLAFHFTDFSFPMQIAIFAGITLIFYFLTFVAKRFSPLLAHLSLMIAFLLLILGGLHFLRLMDISDTGLLVFLFVICILFCLNGILFRFLYLVYCGLIGLGLLYGRVTLARISMDYSWWSGELYWVPVACLMVGTGFLLHQRNARMAGALSICGLLYFFGPELQALYITAAKQDTIQLLLFLKIFVASLFFFLTRHYWFSWLRL